MSQQPQREEAREAYERVLRIVEYQAVGPGLPGMVPRRLVVYIAARCTPAIPPRRTRSIIFTAREQNGDLIEHQGRLAPVTRRGLVDAIEWEVERAGETDAAFVARCNELLDDLQAEDGGGG